MSSPARNPRAEGTRFAQEVDREYQSFRGEIGLLCQRVTASFTSNVAILYSPVKINRGELLIEMMGKFNFGLWKSGGYPWLFYIKICGENWMVSVLKGDPIYLSFVIDLMY